jgi:hypothetical protein
MDKSKYAQATYLDLYGEAIAAYAKLVLRTNDLMMDYTAAIAATMLQRPPSPLAAAANVSASPPAVALPNAALAEASGSVVYEALASIPAIAAIPAAAAPDVVLEPSAEAPAQIPPRPKKRAGNGRRRKK